MRQELCELAPFAVFCAYYLGITPTDGYAPPRPGPIARHFELSEAELSAYLLEHHLDPERVRASGFDLESASLDIRVAPEGVSRTELARPLFEELQKALEEA